MIDDHRKINPVLRKAMLRIFENRRPLRTDVLAVSRTERVNDSTFCEIWFMTGGCSHDAKGGCTMCNYGKGHQVTDAIVLQKLKEKIATLPRDIEELIVTPTGSMLDDDEVNPQLRKKILEMMIPLRCQDFLVETRADTVTQDKLDQLKCLVNARRINIEIGIECLEPWVLRNCVNKNMDLDDVRRALDLIHSNGMYACANIGVGIPMLTECHSIELASRSLKLAFDMGFDSAVLFPYHVKPGTLSALLYENGMYRCCSLWALPEVIGYLPEQYRARTTISWYRNYYDDPEKVIASPDLCPDCREEVLSLLDAYRNHPGSEALEPLLSYRCGCRDAWRARLARQQRVIDFRQVSEIYDFLSEKFGIPGDKVAGETAYMRKTLEETANA